MEPLVLDGRPLAIDEVESVARDGRAVELSARARARVQQAREAVAAVAAGQEAVYGINTGFGSLSRVRIAPAEVRQVQRNLLRSHAAGVGEPLAADVVRAMLLILAASLARGHSGVRPAVIEQILHLLNHGITPVVPSRGSVGASGDLAPLAHAALVLIGEGEATVFDAERSATVAPMSGGDALQSKGIEPIQLEAKEGLALINGTHLMCAIGALAMGDVARLERAAVCAAALAVDACRATDSPFDPRVNDVRRQPGQVRVARDVCDLLGGSAILTSHKVDDPRVQDPYCLRAIPQVIGAACDAIEWVRGVFERELGAVTDNPLVFAGERSAVSGRRSAEEVIASQTRPRAPSTQHPALSILSGGNFHGMPLAIALDTLTIALSHIAGIAERRIYWLLQASDSENPVNIYLSPQPGLHSGLMIVQYTAAACCNEIATLAAPASVHNIPTSAGIEDYNSMGATSAHQARQAVDLCTNVIACELLVMTEALEYQRPLRSGAGVERIYDTVRTVVPQLTEDRPPAPDIAAIGRLIRTGAFE